MKKIFFTALGLDIFQLVVTPENGAARFFEHRDRKIHDNIARDPSEFSLFAAEASSSLPAKVIFFLVSIPDLLNASGGDCNSNSCKIESFFAAVIS